MNKKFSTLMAVFLAAGATFTAEAGVVLVKGGDLKANDQVIIVNKEIPTDGTAAKVLTVGSGTLSLAEITNGTSEEALEAFLWKVGASQTSLVWANDGTKGLLYSGGWQYGTVGTLTALATGTATNSTVIQESSASKFLDLTGGTVAENTVTKDVYCYMITTPVLKNIEAQPISIETNKYLVASKDGKTASIVALLKIFYSWVMNRLNIYGM